MLKDHMGLLLGLPPINNVKPHMIAIKMRGFSNGKNSIR